MSLRVLLGGLLGGIAVFLWGFVFWAVLPFSKTSLPKMPNEAAVMKALDESIPTSGTYVFPTRSEGDHDSMKAQYAAGPVGTIAFHKGGVNMEDPKVFIAGFLHFAACAAIIGAIMTTVIGSLRTYGRRALFAFQLGLFAAVAIELAKPIWWYAPTDFIWLNVAFHVVGWGLAGLVIAAVVKPPATA